MKKRPFPAMYLSNYCQLLPHETKIARQEAVGLDFEDDYQKTEETAKSTGEKHPGVENVHYITHDYNERWRPATMVRNF